MPRATKPKTTVVGKLRYIDSEGLRYSYSSDRPRGTQWVEALRQWPGFEHYEDLEALHRDPNYQVTAKKILLLQQSEPQRLWVGPWSSLWAYKDQVFSIHSNEPETVRDKEQEALLVKHYLLRRDKDYERVCREVEALENLDKLDHSPREPIPESVRLFVWQRDGGRCVKCGSRQRIEFDHIIPLVAGGSNTERNIQLLCEPCNRSKGSTI